MSHDHPDGGNRCYLFTRIPGWNPLTWAGTWAGRTFYQAACG